MAKLSRASASSVRAWWLLLFIRSSFTQKRPCVTPVRRSIFMADVKDPQISEGELIVLVVDSEA